VHEGGDELTITHTESPIIQEDHYYPFGLTMRGIGKQGSNPFKYNGFEEQDELDLGLYDYQARYYDPALGRFINVDRAADLMRRHSPYNYAFNNPIRFVDPDGMIAEDQVKQNKECPDCDENNSSSTTVDNDATKVNETNRDPSVDLIESGGLPDAFWEMMRQGDLLVQVEGEAGEQEFGNTVTTQEGGADPTEQTAKVLGEEIGADLLILGTKKAGAGKLKPGGDLRPAETIKKAGAAFEEINKQVAEDDNQNPGQADTIKFFPTITNFIDGSNRQEVQQKGMVGGDTIILFKRIRQRK